MNDTAENLSGTMQPDAGGETKTRVSLYDFDGTLTRRDTLIAIIRYARGTAWLLFHLLLLAPRLVLMKLRLCDNGRTKEKLFGRCFGGMTLQAFNDLCRRFAQENREALLRPDGMAQLRHDLGHGARVMIVSASIDNWVAPFFQGLSVEMVGTRVEVSDGRLTGRFLTPNCYGKEKVRRAEALLTEPRSHYYIEATGDSRGDKEMIAYADKGYYRRFRG